MTLKADAPLWSILIATIPHRHDKLVRLLATLDAQMRPGVEVIVYRDNLEVPWVKKCRDLELASAADYVSHLDDDDMVSPDFVPRIVEAMETGPDYVGFKVRWFEDGIRQRPVIHSLTAGGWHDAETVLFRDLTDKNPLRRELALQATWRGGNGADRLWAYSLRSLGVVKTEAFIPDELYLYVHDTFDTFLTIRDPMPAPLPELPEYPWLRSIP